MFSGNRIVVKGGNVVLRHGVPCLGEVSFEPRTQIAGRFVAMWPVPSLIFEISPHVRKFLEGKIYSLLKAESALFHAWLIDKMSGGVHQVSESWEIETYLKLLTSP